MSDDDFPAEDESSSAEEAERPKGKHRYKRRVAWNNRVELSPHREAIELRLARGETSTALAQEYGIHDSTLRRHRRKMKEGFIKAVKTSMAPRERTLTLAEAEHDNFLSGLVSQKLYLLDLQRKAEAMGELNVAVSCASQIAKIIDQIGRHVGAVRDTPSTVINNVGSVNNKVVEPDYTALLDSMSIEELEMINNINERLPMKVIEHVR